MEKINRLIFTIILISASCTPPPYKFTVSELYVSGGFTGRNFGSSSICMGPVLSERGVDSTGFLSSLSEYQSINKIRQDLHLVQTSEFESKFIKKTSLTVLNEFYNKLFNCEMLNLQTNDTFWKSVPGDYLMVFRLKKALKLKTFSNIVRKEVALEAEVWDCSEMKVVWRILVKGSGVNDNLTDSKFVFEAVQKAYKSIPSAQPFYENGSW
jgi:hypothetical protein